MGGDNIKNILYLFGSVRRIIAIALTFVFCYLTISSDIKSDQFIPIFSMVLGYYFGKSTALETNTHEDNNYNRNNNGNGDNDDMNGNEN